MRFKRKERGKKLKYILLGLIGVALAAAVVWVLATRLEGQAPVVVMDMESMHIPAEAEIPVTVKDEKSGIRKVFASILQEDREVVLANMTFGEGVSGVDDANTAVDLVLRVNVREHGLKDGEAMLRIAAWDGSWRGWFSGNTAYLEQEINIDSRSPRISPVTRQHNLRQGGAGLVAYRLSESCEKHGIRVGDNFFQGRAGYADNKEVYMAFFALGHDQGDDTEISLFARDKAGNEGRSGLHYYIQNRTFDSEGLTISDTFIRKVLPEFQSDKDLPIDESLRDQFLYINRDLRVQNNETLLSLHKNSENELYWEGVFQALPRAQRRSGFADHRTYIYNGEVIDEANHMGVDLASLRQAPVPAANRGRIAFADWIGIYGNTVVIDHGFGLMSLYSHLSATDVEVGDVVHKGDIIGNTGTTGLAGGDHLHFSMIVGNVFVDPYEWWDGAWIKNNITGKLENVAETAEK
ncbi:MAG: M23 family metallopeptidase [Desulfosalsimonadaceae bacterium]